MQTVHRQIISPQEEENLSKNKYFWKQSTSFNGKRSQIKLYDFFVLFWEILKKKISLNFKVEKVFFTSKIYEKFSNPLI